MRRPLLWFALLASASVPACGSDERPPPAGTPFTVWVFDERLTFHREDTPLANVRVAFDPPGGGERVTRTTEADGHVTFEGDFAIGGASVTVLSPDHVYTTMLEASPDTARARPNTLGKPDADLVVFPPRLDGVTERRTVELRGTIAGKRDPNHVVSLATSALPRLGTYQALESTFILRAPRDRPFFVLGHEARTLVDRHGVIVENEILKAFRIDLPARSDDQLLDLDLPKLPALPTKVIHVRADVPSSFGSGTQAFAAVQSLDSGLVVGPFSRARATTDGRSFAIDVTVAETDIAPERLLSRAILTGPDGSQSVRAEQGAMPDGFVWSDFPVAPSVVEPDASRTVRDPIVLEGFAPGAELTARVYAGGGLLWILHGPPGGLRAKSFTIPYRDEVKSVDVQIFALSVTAESDLVRLPRGGDFHRRTSTFRDVILRRR